MWMRNHLRRKARDIYERTHAPAVSDKQILQVAFLRKDSGRSGDVTVSEFAAVWNSDDGLLLKARRGCDKWLSGAAIVACALTR